MDDESTRMAMLLNEDYADAVKKDLTEKFKQRLKIVARSRQNFIVSIFGPQGYGKSFVMLFLMSKYSEYAGIPLKIGNVAFTVTDMIELVSEGRRGEIYFLDEQVKTRGYGSKAESESLENIEMTVRAHKLSLFFSAPKFIPHQFHYFLEVWERGSDRKWNFNKPMEDQWKYTKCILYDHRENALGYIVTSTPSDGKFLKEYEEKKDHYINEYRQMRFGKRPFYLYKIGKSLLDNEKFMEKFLSAKTKNYKRLVLSIDGAMISNVSGLTITEQNMLVDFLTYESITKDVKVLPKSDKRGRKI